MALADVEKLKRTMFSVNKVIDYAEEKQTADPSFKEWLDELKDAVYDAEDVLDVISTAKMETTFTKLPSSWNPFDIPIDQALNNAFEKLHYFIQQKDAQKVLKESNPAASSRLEIPMSLTNHVTTSFVQSGVHGRDDDKAEIVKLLQSNDGSNVSVIAIVGMGGIGKTTLSQFVFNDYRINSVFNENKVWICVGKNFDVIKIIKTILEKLTKQSCSTDDFDDIQMKLRQALYGKMYLIVLDNVWTENYMNWDSLQSRLEYGAPGSKILVTTRIETVASVVRATSTYKLKLLSYEPCRKLFDDHAFKNIPLNDQSTFEELARELVKKCGGIPLAAKVLGGLLGTKLRNEEWDEILRSDIWDFSDEASKDILPVLRLSYHYLPSNLKRCFAFCSLVPKKFDFEREKLVLLWMAENLLQDSKSKRRINVGYKNLRELESRSLIQPSIRGDQLYFSMHDLVNDLAKYVSGELYKSFDIGNPTFNVGEKTRHFSYEVTSDDPVKFEGVSEAKRLRTFLPLCRDWIQLPPLLYSKVWPKLNVLRSLTLASHAYISIEILPDSIGNLKLLRYLDLSGNQELKKLPESLANLYNLEVLNLSACSSLTKLPESLARWYKLEVLNLSFCVFLTKLPESLARLYNLEVLNLADCRSLTKLPSKMRQLIKLNHLHITDLRLKEMPLQMGRLKDLDVLTDFVVGKNSGSSIAELKELKYLRGDLRISGLQNITHPNDAFVANLREKSRLEELSLIWEDIDSDNSEDARIILENLRPHVNLKKLYIESYSGTILPDWSGDHSFINLASIKIFDFKHCFDMSPLGQLPSLKSLYIRWCASLVALVGTEDIGHFPALVDLMILDCPKLELPQQNRFTSIEDFTLTNWSCTSLQLFPLSLFPKLKKLNLEYLQSIESLAVIDGAYNVNLEYLEAIRIMDCPNFEFIIAGKWCAPKMTDLTLKNCARLKVLPENMCNVFPSLLKIELTHCLNLEALPQTGLPRNLTTLTISDCYKLVANRSSWGLQRLHSLSTLQISEYLCDDLESFPEEGLLPSSLSTLQIYNFPFLRSLNGKSFQLLTSLETISLYDCVSLQCLPEMPTTLSTLLIEKCRLLKSRCQRERGEDWSKIAHIPNIQVDS